MWLAREARTALTVVASSPLCTLQVEIDQGSATASRTLLVTLRSLLKSPLPTDPSSTVRGTEATVEGTAPVDVACPGRASNVGTAVDPLMSTSGDGETSAPSNAERVLSAATRPDEFDPELPVAAPRLLVVATTGALPPPSYHPSVDVMC